MSEGGRGKGVGGGGWEGDVSRGVLGEKGRHGLEGMGEGAEIDCGGEEGRREERATSGGALWGVGVLMVRSDDSDHSVMRVALACV